MHGLVYNIYQGSSISVFRTVHICKRFHFTHWRWWEDSTQTGDSTGLYKRTLHRTNPGHCCVVFTMILVKFVCAIVTRSLFILVSLIGVWRVKTVKNDNMYWLLTVLYLPLVVEMFFTLKRRKGKDYKWWVTQHIIIHDLQCWCHWSLRQLLIHTFGANYFYSIYLELNICYIWLFCRQLLF